jgi:HK97 family phage prohead protease
MKRKALDAKFNPTASGFEAIITTEALDRDGEVVIPQGMNSTEYEANPVLFFNHDYTQPIGKCVKLTRTPQAIKGEFVFAKRPEGYEGSYFPEFVASLVSQGIVKGVSIGYRPEDGGLRRATIDDRKRYGPSVSTVFSKWKLLEVSVAPLPANPTALVSAIRKGLVSGADARKWLNVETSDRITIEIPATNYRSRDAGLSIQVNEVVRREIARRRGQLWI